MYTDTYSIAIDVSEDGENGSHAVYEVPVMGGI